MEKPGHSVVKASVYVDMIWILKFGYVDAHCYLI